MLAGGTQHWLAADAGVVPDLKMSSPVLLRRVTVTWWDHKVVNHNYLACLVLLPVRVGVVNWGQVLLVVEAINIPLDLLRERTKVSKGVRRPTDDVGVVPGSSTTIIHHVLTLSLCSQALVAAEEAQGVYRDHFSLLQSRRRNNFQLQVVIALASVHHFGDHLFIIL